VTVRTDRRQIDSHLRADVHRDLVARQPSWLDAEIRHAKDLAAIARAQHHAEVGFASLREFVTHLGYRGTLAPAQARLGQALLAEPDLEQRVRDGRVRIENAEAIAPVLLDASLRGQDDWLRMAGEYSLPTLRQVVRRRIEEIAQQEQVMRLVLFVTGGAMEDFRRARGIVEEKARARVTEGQAFGAIVGDYLDRHDPLRRAERWAAKDGAKDVARGPEAGASAGAGGERTGEGAGTTDAGAARSGSDAGAPGASAPGAGAWRSEPPSDRKRRRALEAQVRHNVWLRARGECEFPGCHATKDLEICHSRPWRYDGPDHEWNLVLLCHRHHVLLDSGQIRTCVPSKDDRWIFLRGASELVYPEPRAPP
jgi:hypothetical protein